MTIVNSGVFSSSGGLTPTDYAIAQLIVSSIQIQGSTGVGYSYITLWLPKDTQPKYDSHDLDLVPTATPVGTSFTKSLSSTTKTFLGTQYSIEIPSIYGIVIAKNGKRVTCSYWGRASITINNTVYYVEMNRTCSFYDD